MSLEIAWHNLEPSPSVEREVHQRFQKLESICPEIMGARVAIDQPHNSKQHPHRYEVTLDVHVPGSTMVINHAGREDIQSDLHQLVHHTFDAARRQVLEYTRIRQGKVKRHSMPAVDAVPEHDDPDPDSAPDP